MSIRTMLDITLIVVILILCVALWRNRKSDESQGFANYTQAIFHIAATVGILTTGAWVLWRQEWIPKAAVEIHAEAQPVMGSNPSIAVVQVRVKVTNAGRVPHTFTDIRFAARGYDGTTANADQFGDLANRPLDSFVHPNPMRVMPDEADFAYAELRVPCSERLVQILVKIAEPEHPTKDPELRLAYERKSILPISKACAGSTRASGD